jgi:hypothetical protein
MSDNAIAWLMANNPQMATVKDVELIKTGIEYPLASGPHTFTTDELISVVESQSDPAIASPRIWLGHADDDRIHGGRHPGAPPSGEPAVGMCKDLFLADSGHTLRGNLEGTPLWLAKIMGVAYPSRSVEASMNVETVTGKKWPLVMSGLALLGVCWPGVSTLNDIAALYTADGPEGIQIIEGTSEQPVTITAAADRQVRGQATVEDVRREFYDNIGSMDIDAWSWIRSMYLDPDELIVDDDNGNLYRVPFSISGDSISFDDPKEVKIQFVNAANGGLNVAPIKAGSYLVATFSTKEDSRIDNKAREMVIDLTASKPQAKGGEVNIDLRAASSNTVTINLKEKR